MRKLKWIKRKDIYNLCKEIIDNISKKSSNIEEDLHNNIIDPFSAIFDASLNNMSIEEWLESEKSRQIQKSLQNLIGEFHQKILGKIKGWEDLGTGNVVDLVCKEKKIIAEIKNKYNTTKGNHKTALYDDLNNRINSTHKGFTGYYVAILSKKKLNRPFTPSDNKINRKRDINENIREIDGASFYEIATGDKNAIYNLYSILPEIIASITRTDKNNILKDPLFTILFLKAFKK